MKNYLTLAALLGVIAFVSVSFLAQAEPEHNVMSMERMERKAASPAIPVANDIAETVIEEDLIDPEMDMADECLEIAATAHADGTERSAAEQDTAFTDCMASKANEMIEEEALSVVETK